jgi:hypothetical protein
MQVANHQKSEMVDARDHALWKTVHCGCARTAFSSIWGLDTMEWSNDGRLKGSIRPTMNGNLLHIEHVIMMA